MTVSICVFAALLPTQSTLSPMERAAFVIRRVQPTMTLADLRRLMPANTNFSPPTWMEAVDGVPTGSLVRFTQPVRGAFSFLSDSQRASLREFKSDFDKTYADGHTIQTVQFVIHSAPKVSKSTGYGLVRQVQRLLGRPSHNPFYSADWANDFGGWSAAWRINGRKVGLYQYQGETYETRLEVEVGKSIFQGSDIEQRPPVSPNAWQ